MKNKLLFSSAFKKPMQTLLLVFLFLTGFMSFSQSNKKAVVSSDLKVASTVASAKDPMQDVANLKKDTPNVPTNYTATKVSLSANAAPEVKAEFFKKHNADYFYIYSDNKGKTVTKEEVDYALQLVESNSITKSPITNPKK